LAFVVVLLPIAAYPYNNPSKCSSPPSIVALGVVKFFLFYGFTCPILFISNTEEIL
jgi:hypothetical protein